MYAILLFDEASNRAVLLNSAETNAEAQRIATELSGLIDVGVESPLSIFVEAGGLATPQASWDRASGIYN